MELTDEMDRANCDVPRVITAEEYSHHWDRVNAAMDASMR